MVYLQKVIFENYFNFGLRGNCPSLVIMNAPNVVMLMVLNAQVWKNLIFFSPSLYQSFLALCLYLMSSFSKQGQPPSPMILLLPYWDMV